MADAISASLSAHLMAEEKDLLSVTVTVPVRKRRRRPPAFKSNDGIHSVRLRHGLVRRRMPYWPVPPPPLSDQSLIHFELEQHTWTKKKKERNGSETKKNLSTPIACCRGPAATGLA